MPHPTIRQRPEQIIQQQGKKRGKQKTAILAADTAISPRLNIGFIGGTASEGDAFLGLEGTEAFTLEDADTTTTFVGTKFGAILGEDFKLSGMFTRGVSNMERQDYGIISGASDVVSSSFGLALEKRNLFGNDALSVSFGQPNRVENGSMTVKLSNLPDSNGNLTYRNQSVSVAPSGRQKDLGITYTRSVNDNFTLSTKIMATDELNHVKDAKKTYSEFIGVKSGNLKLGATNSSNRKGLDAEASYSLKF